MLQVFKCESTCTTCDKAQYNEASFREKFCLVLHIVFCKSCREYVRNNRKLTKQVHSKLEKLDPEIKAQMQTKIESELGKTTDL